VYETLNNISDDGIDWLRVGLIVLYVTSAVFVTVGVFLEKEDFEESQGRKAG
jgi:hypothetical protein